MSNITDYPDPRLVTGFIIGIVIIGICTIYLPFSLYSCKKQKFGVKSMFKVQKSPKIKDNFKYAGRKVVVGNFLCKFSGTARVLFFLYMILVISMWITYYVKYKEDDDKDKKMSNKYLWASIGLLTLILNLEKSELYILYSYFLFKFKV
jgi:hypothetical protein